MLKDLVEKPWFRDAVGGLVASYLRLVWRSCRKISEPADFGDQPGITSRLIATTWHGEHFMASFALPKGWKAKAMISRSRDGALNVAIVEHLGIGAVRASGGRSGAEIQRRGGVRGFIAAVKELEAGNTMMITADVPKVGKVVGEGVIRIAARSGAPLQPFVTVTTNRIRMKSWDRAAFHLPFGRFVSVYGRQIFVEADADAETIEAKRQELQAELERVVARAYELAGGRDV